MTALLHRFAYALAFAIATWTAGTATAGPVVEFETLLRAAYADYRTALFQTNAKNADASQKAIVNFETKWDAIALKFRSAPPPQYADDPKWGKTLDEVTKVVKTAKTIAARGDLADAHESLEKIRDSLGELRARNGIAAYSDRINAFHAQLEHVLESKYGGFSAEGLAELREDVAVLAYLAAGLGQYPPPEAADSPEFKSLVQGVRDVVAAIRTAVRSGEADKVKAALSKLKPAYARLFVKFG